MSKKQKLSLKRKSLSFEHPVLINKKTSDQVKDDKIKEHMYEANKSKFSSESDDELLKCKATTLEVKTSNGQCKETTILELSDSEENDDDLLSIQQALIQIENMRKCNPTAVTPLPVVKESGRMKPERQVVENKAIKTMHMPLPPYCKMCRRIARGRVTFPEPTNLEENVIISTASPEDNIIPGSPTISGKQNPFTNKSLRKHFKKHCNENHIDLALKAISAQQSGNTCGQISTPQQNNVAVLAECNSNQQKIGSNKTERKSKNSMGQVYPTIQEASTSHDLDNNAVRKCPTSHDLDNNAVRKCPTSHDLDNNAVRKCPTSHDLENSAIRKCPTSHDLDNNVVRKCPTSHDLDNNAVRKCPMCGLQFIHSMSSVDRDGHIAACLSETGDDIMW